MKYQVIVGNVGTVHDTDDETEANAVFEMYRKDSLDGYGRAAHEDVTLMEDGEPTREHHGNREDVA